MRTRDAEIARPAALVKIALLLTDLQSTLDVFYSHGGGASYIPEKWETCLTLAQAHCVEIRELLNVVLATGHTSRR